MIIIDTHVWVWWVHGDAQLSQQHAELIQENEETQIGLCAISLWEVAKLAELGRLNLPCAIEEWLEQALAYPGIELLELTPEVAIESTQLPGNFHRDPADQLIVATARVFDCPLVTADDAIRTYAHVDTP